MYNNITPKKRKKGGGSAPPSDPPCKGTSPLNPFILVIVTSALLLITVSPSAVFYDYDRYCK
ncbi:hypothetical protein MBAV_001080 [Candidatus Magnetobacterium bavaricum]|uniref:Uncharacterized protein n=1 Tax=Candidatus Magnetobacterium bavaricum TaxID=29290 RepID=A0A0F3GXK7_9BACT|nr:hypothetical protein MBAV_001080 [Candidatus Magnetobacterium bavaricum]